MNYNNSGGGTFRESADCEPTTRYALLVYRTTEVIDAPERGEAVSYATKRYANYFLTGNW